MARRAINGAKTSAHDLIIDVGILSTGDDFPGIELINFSTSFADGGCNMPNNSPVCFGSAYKSLASLPEDAIRDSMPDLIVRILVVKYSTNIQQMLTVSRRHNFRRFGRM